MQLTHESSNNYFFSSARARAVLVVNKTYEALLNLQYQVRLNLSNFLG